MIGSYGREEQTIWREGGKKNKNKQTEYQIFKKNRMKQNKYTK
jgi:hypothetical protein